MPKRLIKTSFFVLLGLLILVNGCEKIQAIYSVNSEKCIRCRLCIPACGYGAIRVDSVPYLTADSISYTTTIMIDAQKCIGCGECQIVCPAIAIHSNMTKEVSLPTNTVPAINNNTTTTTTGTTTSSTYSVNSSQCTGCGRCLGTCPYGAISFSGRKAVINTSKCTGCGRCVAYCPRSAIHKN